MDKRKILIAFAILAIIQLAVPAKMILGRESILEEGKEFRFETAPIDPNDPFRGKYIILNFKNTEVMVDQPEDWVEREIYAMLSADAKGFAKIDSVVSEKPKNGDFIKVKYAGSAGKKLFISYPFDRFYMEESKAPVAEKEYIRVSRDSSKVAWAVVRVKDGDAVLEDVMIENVSVTKLVKK